MYQQEKYAKTVRKACQNVTKLLHKHEIHGCYEAEEGCKMVPMKLLALEHHACNNGEDSERDNLLNDLELHECEWSAVSNEAHLVGWHLQHVFEKRYAPREGNDSYEWP